MNLSAPRLLRAFTLPLVLFSLATYAQELRSNVSFNSYFVYDSAEYIKGDKVYHPKSDPYTSLSVDCFDHDVEPDSAKLRQHLKNTVENFEKRQKDTAAWDSILQLPNSTLEVGHLQLERGFFGLYKIVRRMVDSTPYFFLHFDTYNYDPHCFCEFHMERSFLIDSADLADTAWVNGFVQGLVTKDMDEVRAENEQIRKTYTVHIDSLPLENLWYRVTRVQGRMTRDTVTMETLDSADWLPKFQFNTITFKGALTIEPALGHPYKGLHLNNLKNAYWQGDSLIVELRDAEGGIVSHGGWITIENSLGYPLELPFRFEYRNYLFDRLRRVR